MPFVPPVTRQTLFCRFMRGYFSLSSSFFASFETASGL